MMARTGDISSFPLWKAILGGFYLWAIFTGGIWLDNSIYLWKTTSLRLFDILLGGIIFPLYLGVWWSSKKYKKINAWPVWLSNLGLSTYISLMLWSGAFKLVLRLLSPSWKWTLASAQIVIVFVTFLVLSMRPNIFESLLQRGIKGLGIIGALLGGGTGGALLGMYSMRYGWATFFYSLFAFILWSLGMILFWGSLYTLWHHRPWVPDHK